MVCQTRSVKRPIYVSFIVIVVAASAILGAAYFLGIFDPHPRLALDTFNQMYGTEASRLDTCETCHIGRRRTNVYGSDVKSAVEKMMRPPKRDKAEAEIIETFRALLKSVEELDSDNDGYSNIDEIAARTFPGDPVDHPLASP